MDINIVAGDSETPLPDLVGFSIFRDPLFHILIMLSVRVALYHSLNPTNQ